MGRDTHTIGVDGPYFSSCNLPSVSGVQPFDSSPSTHVTPAIMASNRILLPVADQSPSTAGSLSHLSSLFPAAPELLSLTVGILLGATVFSYRRRRSDHQRQDLESIAVAREPKDQLPTPPPHPLLSLPQSPPPPPLYDAQSTKPPPPPSAFTDLPPPLRTTLHSQVGPPVTSTDLASRPWRRVTYPLPRHPCDPRATEVHVTQGVQFFLQPESLLPIDGNGDGDAAASEKYSQQQQ